MAIVNESYVYRPFAADADGVVTSDGGALGGFFCTTAGTLSITENDAVGATVVASFAVAVGVFYTLPFTAPVGVRLFANLGGGAAGTFAGN